MPSFAKILVPTDFSTCAEAALDRALDLARVEGGRLLLLHVYQMPPIYPTGPTYSAELIRSIEASAHTELAKARSGAIERAASRGGGVVPEIATKLVLAGAVDGILAEARDGKYDLIVIGTHGRTGLKHFVLGSVAERVVRMAPCPVLTIRGASMAGDATTTEIPGRA